MYLEFSYFLFSRLFQLMIHYFHSITKTALPCYLSAFHHIQVIYIDSVAISNVRIQLGMTMAINDIKVLFQIQKHPGSRMNFNTFKAMPKSIWHKNKINKRLPKNVPETAIFQENKIHRHKTLRNRTCINQINGISVYILFTK